MSSTSWLVAFLGVRARDSVLQNLPPVETLKDAGRRRSQQLAERLLRSYQSTTLD